MRAWMFIPLVALVACMDTSKDDDEEDEETEGDDDLDDFGGGVGAGSGGGGGDEGGSGGSGGDGGSGSGSGSGSGGSSGSGDDGGGADFDGVYTVDASGHVMNLVTGDSDGCDLPLDLEIDGGAFNATFECEGALWDGPISLDGTVDDGGFIVGTGDVRTASGVVTLDLWGEIDGGSVDAGFEGFLEPDDAYPLWVFGALYLSR
jgi:hypothetical protein